MKGATTVEELHAALSKPQWLDPVEAFRVEKAIHAHQEVWAERVSGLMLSADYVQPVHQLVSLWIPVFKGPFPPTLENYGQQTATTRTVKSWSLHGGLSVHLCPQLLVDPLTGWNYPWPRFAITFGLPGHQGFVQPVGDRRPGHPLDNFPHAVSEPSTHDLKVQGVPDAEALAAMMKAGRAVASVRHRYHLLWAGFKLVGQLRDHPGFTTKQMTELGVIGLPDTED